MAFKRIPSREDIARRAFQLYMARGCQHGQDLDDWLAAEKELNESGKRASRAVSVSRKAA